jgi:hypothetical protein
VAAVAQGKLQPGLHGVQAQNKGMTLRLASEEPEAGPWRAELLSTIGKPGEAPAPWHHRQWMAEERPFNTAQRTWERAGLIVCGTPQIPRDPATEIVLAPPLTPAS